MFLFDQTTTIKWIARDIKGNVSEVRSAGFVIEPVPLAGTVALAPVSSNSW